jgi:hypothetical protein
MTEPKLNTLLAVPPPVARPIRRDVPLMLAGIVALVLAAGLLAIMPAHATCVCRCVNEVMQPLCDNAIEVRPICPPTVCPIAPPSVAPINPPRVPPVGTQQCVQRQVLNPQTHMYEWRTVCY